MPLPTRNSPGDLVRPAFTYVEPTMPAQGEDVTTLLQAAKRSLKAGQAIRLPAGTWTLSNNLHTDEADTGLVGAVEAATHEVGTKLLHTNPERAGYQVHGQGRGVLTKGAHNHWLEGIHFEVLGWETRGDKDRTGQNEAGHSPVCLRNGVTGVHMQDVVSIGAKAAGIFNYQTSGTRGNRLKVKHTQADGIHSNKWTDAEFTDCETEDTGDDCIAGVSYNWDKLSEQGIGMKVYRFAGKGNKHGRGLAYINSRQLDAYDIDVTDTGAAGLILARETREGGLLADGLTDVSVEKMVIERANHRSYDDHGAVLLVNGNDGEYARVRLRDFDIVDTCKNRPYTGLAALVKTPPNFAGQTVRQIGYGKPQGKFTDVVAEDFRFWGVGPRDQVGGNVAGLAGFTRDGWAVHTEPFVRGTVPEPELQPVVEHVTVWLKNAQGQMSMPFQIPVTLLR
jgi:hypothetical protein